MINSEFRKNVLTLFSGTTIAQAFPIILQPLLRRIYSPEDFGLFAIYMSLVGILAVIASLKYEMAIVLPKDDKESVQLYLGSVLMAFIFSVAITLLIYYLNERLCFWFNISQTSGYILFFVPISILLFSIGNAGNFLLIKKKKFKYSALNKLGRRFSEGIVQSGAGLLKMKLGLVFGDLLGLITNILMVNHHIKKIGFSLKSETIEAIKKTLYAYRNFPLYSAIPALLNTASLMLPVFIINRLYEVEMTGQFDLCRQVLVVPSVLIATSISQVLFQRIAEKRNQAQSVRSETNKLFLLLASITGITTLIFYFFSVPLFTFIFGSQWAEAGSLAQFLIFSFGIKFIVSPLSVVLTVFEKLKQVAVWQFFYFLAITALFFLKSVDIFYFIKLLVFIDLLFYLIYSGIIYYHIGQYEKSIS